MHYGLPVRNVDDLGRIQIPKDIRKQFGIKEGQPLEFVITEEGLLLKKVNLGGKDNEQK